MAEQVVGCVCAQNAGTFGCTGTSSWTRDRLGAGSSLRSEFLGQNGRVSLRRRSRDLTDARCSSGGFGVEMALSREKKEATVEKARQQLEGAYFVAGINYGGLNVKQFQTLRKSLPENSTLIVAKNKLIGKAIEGTKWEALKPALKGMNAWLFVHTEEIPAAIKPYRALQKELKLEKNDFTGAVFEGKFYPPSEFQLLESMPTRAEMYAKLLDTLQSPASSLVSVLQAPARELILTLKAYVAKLEEEQGGQAQS